MTYIYICKAPYMPCIYAYMVIYTLAHSLCSIYIYMQRKTLNNRVQATDAAVSSSQHSITIHEDFQKLLTVFIEKHLDSTGTV